jgi:hypothetical protein
MTSKTELEVDEFVNRTNRAYARRVELIKRLATQDIEAIAETDFENYTATRAGMSAQSELVKLIRELSEYRAHVRETALKDREQLEKTLGASEPVQFQKAKLQELRKTLSELSDELSSREWLNFAIGFGKQVQQSREKSREGTADAEKKANAAATTAKNRPGT